jgi:hypothetical protein
METGTPRYFTAALVTFALGLSASVSFARDDDDRDKPDRVAARLSSFNEVHFIGGTAPALRGAISSKASGRFKATIDDNGQMIHYELSYEGLESTVTQAHIHFGQRHTVGGITVWLCQTTTNPAPAAVSALTPTCPQEGTVSGTITPAQVLPVTGQGIDAGEFAEVVRAIRAGATYANVHTQTFGPGEIRGQLYGGHGHR